MITNNTSRNIQEIRQRGVPLLDLKRQYAPLQSQIVEALAKVVETCGFVLGPELTKLEQTIAEYSQVKHMIGCASGSDALLLALMAYDIGPGDEVIVPSFTFFATASAVARLGATPVFADIDPVSFNMDPAHVESLITAKTKAIIPVHLYGQVADMDSFCEMGRKHNIAIIEDAAQSIGAELNGQRAGCMGSIGCFSFYPTKNLGGAGDGGMVSTNDDEIAHKLRLLRVHGMEPRYYHSVVGINSRIDAFQSVVLNIKMQHIERWTELRIEIAKRYTEMFIEAAIDQDMTLPTAGLSIAMYGTSISFASRTGNAMNCDSFWPMPKSAAKCIIRSVCTNRNALNISDTKKVICRTPMSQRVRFWRYRFSPN